MLGGDEEAVAVETASHSGTEPQTGEGERLTFEWVGGWVVGGVSFHWQFVQELLFHMTGLAVCVVRI